MCMNDIILVVLAVFLAIVLMALVVNFGMWLGIVPGFYSGSRLERVIKAVMKINSSADIWEGISDIREGMVTSGNRITRIIALLQAIEDSEFALAIQKIAELNEMHRLIDSDNYQAARQRIDELEKTLGPDNQDLVSALSLIDFMEMPFEDEGHTTGTQTGQLDDPKE